MHCPYDGATWHFWAFGIVVNSLVACLAALFLQISACVGLLCLILSVVIASNHLQYAESLLFMGPTMDWIRIMSKNTKKLVREWNC